MANPTKLGPAASRMHPKLRMIRNGDTDVNALRSEFSGCIRLIEDAAALSEPLLRGDDAEPLGQRLRAHGRPAKLKAIAEQVEVNVFVSLSDDAGDRPDLKLTTNARSGSLRTMTLPLSGVRDLLQDDYVTYVEPGETLKAPTPIVSNATVSRPDAGIRRVGSSRRHGHGTGVMIGIIDVQGFDFAHPDFLDPSGRTRFLRIWDQGGNARPSPRANNPYGFDYGAEFTDEHMNEAINDSAGLGVPPQEIERQSQRVPGSHGTHVASIAGGNRGVCRNAYLAGVSIALTDEDVDRRKSFYDSTRIAHAVEYLIDLAASKNAALSVNISLGTNEHSHDASSALSRWLDNALAVPGRCICVAAGNAGQAAPESEGDIGYVMGRVHTSGRIAAAGLDTDLGWEVVGNTRVDLSENELEVWYGAQDRFEVSLEPPGGGAWIGPVKPGEYIENHQLDNGSFVSIYNELYHPANGSNYVSAYLSPLFAQPSIVGIPAGRWKLRLHGIEVRDGRYHAWIERDDPRRLGRLGDRMAWRFPSFFSEDTYVDRSTVSSLACGHRVISVANLHEAHLTINATSSQGPTRDEREKPDVAAPGTDIVAARGFDPDEPWISMTGTSMSSPYVCGVAGLMLAVDPTLTAAQIIGVIRRTAKPLPGADYEWADDAGFGVIDASACVREAAVVQERKEVTP